MVEKSGVGNRELLKENLPDFWQAMENARAFFRDEPAAMQITGMYWSILTDKPMAYSVDRRGFLETWEEVSENLTGGED